MEIDDNTIRDFSETHPKIIKFLKHCNIYECNWDENINLFLYYLKYLNLLDVIEHNILIEYEINKKTLYLSEMLNYINDDFSVSLISFHFNSIINVMPYEKRNMQQIEAINKSTFVLESVLKNEISPLKLSSLSFDLTHKMLAFNNNIIKYLKK